MAKPNLLLVDDDKNTLDGLARILKRDGYHVSGVLSGYDALTLLSQKRFDVIITDVNMPGMNGLALIHEVRKKNVPVAVVIITANSAIESTINVGKDTTYDYYLKKPVNVGELKSVLERVGKSNF